MLCNEDVQIGKRRVLTDIPMLVAAELMDMAMSTQDTGRSIMYLGLGPAPVLLDLELAHPYGDIPVKVMIGGWIGILLCGGAVGLHASTLMA